MINVSRDQMIRIKNGLDQVGLQDNYIDYDFSHDVKHEVDKLLKIYDEEGNQINRPKMKDGEFRDQVNELRDLCNEYYKTDQLRARLSAFLKEFKEKIE